MRNSSNVESTGLLTQTAEHALRAILFLAQRPQESTVPAAVIAAGIGAPPNYLGKILNALARVGIVVGARGPAGGFRLERDAATLSLQEVADAFSEPARSRICLLGDRPCSGQHACAAHAKWVELQESRSRALRAVTIADLLSSEVTHIEVHHTAA